MLLVAFVVMVPVATAQVLGPPIPEQDPFSGMSSPLSTAIDLSLTNQTSWDNPIGFLDRATGAMGSEPGEGLSAAVSIMVLLTVITLVPSIMLMTTCFVRIIIVLGLIRQAIGTQSLPPTQVVVALALFMTIMVMTPTLERINAEAIVPYRNGEITDYDTLWERSSAPLRDFMFAQIEATGNWSSLYMILEHRGVDVSQENLATMRYADVPTTALIPAYMLSELKTAFLMGFRVYLPFLVIDIVISSLLISMSMMMLPPVLISLPFKLLLFVLVDGWTLIVGSLLESFAIPEYPVSAAVVGLLLLGRLRRPEHDPEHIPKQPSIKPARFRRVIPKSLTT
ncbi:flagellar type III secretion system pore protein FliP [Roseiflexus sp. AH-315-K22]|nr:flagellar type III secretion system pore protein FliP [Roseiflexus sp. AH-315-K22]